MVDNKNLNYSIFTTQNSNVKAREINKIRSKNVTIYLANWI